MNFMKTFRKIWKAIFQPLLKTNLFQWIVAVLMATCIWFIYLTSWKTITNRNIFKEYRRKPAIFVFWHGRSMMLSPIVRMYGLRGYAIASRHHDGRLMAKLQRVFGLKPIYGSTSEGSLSVLRQSVRKLNENNLVCLSPDGPSGPSLRMKDGALYFAKMTGAPIIPVCYTCNRAWFQNRWDRYLIAKPFSRIRCNVGKPIFVAGKTSPEDFEKIRKKLETFMVKQLRDLDKRYNFPKVEQDNHKATFKRNP